MTATYRRNRLLVAALLAGAAMLTGCSGETGSSTSDDEIVMATEVDTDSLDPQQLTSVQGAMVMSHIYDTLVVMDQKQKDIHPLLAKSWTVSKDGLVYVFTLRDDVTFHSGKKFTAEDVVATLNRWRDSKRPSPSAQTVHSVAKAEATAPNTVTVTLSTADNWLLWNLTMPWASILNSEAIKDPNYGVTEADGTGPFTISEWVPRDHMTLERNENYKWGPEIFENRGPAHLKKLTIRMIPEAATRAAALQTGEVDILPQSGGLLPSLEQLRSNQDLQIVTYPLSNLQFGAFKTGKPQLADVRVRQALNLAVNKQAIIDTVQEGLGTPADGFLQSGMQYHWDGAQTAAYKYNPERAEALLDEAGWTAGADGVREKDGRKLELNVYAGQGSEQELTLVQSDFAKVGVKLNLHLVDRTALYDIRRTETPDINWIWLPYDNADVLRTYFSCDQRPSPNRFNFCEKRYDDLMQVGLTSQDKAAVTNAYAQAQKIVQEEALALPLYHRHEFMSVSKSVTGLEPFQQFNIAVFKSLDLRHESK